jgi:hypothetical protein
MVRCLGERVREEGLKIVGVYDQAYSGSSAEDRWNDALNDLRWRVRDGIVPEPDPEYEAD